MLRLIKSIKDTKLVAADGEIGHCRDFLFDDEQWTIRYMVAETGAWHTGRKVLISPISIGELTPGGDHLPVALTIADDGTRYGRSLNRRIEIAVSGNY